VVLRQSNPEMTTLVSRTIRTVIIPPGPPLRSRSFDLVHDFFIGQRLDTRGFERRSDCEQPVECGHPASLAREEINEVLNLGQLLRRKLPELFENGLFNTRVHIFTLAEIRRP